MYIKKNFFFINYEYFLVLFSSHNKKLIPCFFSSISKDIKLDL